MAATPPSFTLTSVTANNCTGCVIANIQASGSFDFTPPPGQTGTFTLNYRVTDSGNPGSGLQSANAAITITVSGPVIWFVDPNAAINGNGVLGNPFKFLSGNSGANNDADDVDAASHRIFVYSGTMPAANSTLTLNTSEWLIGQGVTGFADFDTLMGITPPSGTIARPSIGSGTATLQNTLTLQTNAIVKAVTLSTAASTGMTDPAGATTGVSVDQVTVTTTTGTALSFNDLGGTLAFVSVSAGTSGTPASGISITTASATITINGGSIQNTTSAAITLDDGAGTFGYAGSISVTTGRAVLVQNKDTGSTNSFGGAITATGGTGILLQNNVTTTSFSGAISLSTGANPAFTASSAGTLSATNTTSVLTTTTATALNVSSTTISASGLTFRSISSNGGTSAGIILNSTGTAGGLHVLGNGSTGTGGVIQNKTGTDITSGSPPVYNGGTQGTGIILKDTSDVQLSWMTLQNFVDFGIFGTNVTGFSLANSTISSTSGKIGDNANVDEMPFRFDNLTGAASITNSIIEDGLEESARILNTGSGGRVLNLTVTGSTFRDAGTSGLLLTGGLNAGDNPTINATLTSNTFTGNVARHLFVVANSAAKFNVNVGSTTANSGGSFTGMPAAMLDIADNSSGNSTFNVRNASFNVNVAPFASVPINIFMGSEASGAFSGTIANNTVTGGNNSGFDGITVTGKGKGATMTIAITNNTVTQVAGTGITVGGAQAGDSNTMNVTIQGNTVTMTDSLASNGIKVDAAVNTTGATTMCAQIGGSTAAQKNTVSVTAAGNNDIRVTSRFAASSMRLPGYVGGTQDATAVGNFVKANNTITDVSVSTGLSPGGTFVGGAACPLP